MKNIILSEITKGLKLRERIIAKIFKRTFIKVYKIGITYGFNNR